MSDNDQKPGKILRTSSGGTRLTAGGEAPEQKSDEPPAPEAAPGSGSGGAVGSGPNAGSANGHSAGPGSAGASDVGSQPAPSAPPVSPAPAAPTAASESGFAGSGPAGSGPTGSGPVSAAPAAPGTEGSGPSGVEGSGFAGGAVSGSAGGSAGASQMNAGGDTAVAPAAGFAGGSAVGSGPATRISSASKGMRLSASAAEADGSQKFGSGPSGAQNGAPAGSTGGDGTLLGGVRTSEGVKVKGKASKKGPRTVRLAAASIDPWSVMKMAFLLSLAIAIAMLIATLVLWLVLQATGVIGTVETTIQEIAGAENAEAILGLLSLGRVMATAFVLALVNIVLMTALSTLFAFLYNLGASIVGGFHLTLTDE